MSPLKVGERIECKLIEKDKTYTWYNGTVAAAKWTNGKQIIDVNYDDGTTHAGSTVTKDIRRLNS